MAVPLTANLERGLAMGNVELSARETGLPKLALGLDGALV